VAIPWSRGIDDNACSASDCQRGGNTLGSHFMVCGTTISRSVVELFV
jgi:hypothetical protein